MNNNPGKEVMRVKDGEFSCCDRWGKTKKGGVSMNKLFKVIVAGFVAISMCTLGTPAGAEPDESVGIPIDIVIPSATSLTVQLWNMAANAAAPDGSSLGFDISGVDIADPSSYWTVANYGLRVAYSSNYAWGVRIITRNADIVETENALPANSINDADAMDDYVAPAYVLDADGNPTLRAFSGLLLKEDMDLGIENEDPSKRATLAWQAFPEADSDIDASGVADYLEYPATCAVVDNNGGKAIDDTTVGGWGANWDYIGDKADDGFTEEIYIGDTADIAGPIVAVGAPGTLGALKPNPALYGTNAEGDALMGDLSGDDGDIVMQLAARFASTNWGVPGDAPFVYILGGGSYSGSLYVELIHE